MYNYIIYLIKNTYILSNYSKLEEKLSKLFL